MDILYNGLVLGLLISLQICTAYELIHVPTDKSPCKLECPKNSICDVDVCRCVNGYRESTNGTCEPICEKACGAHDKCVAPDTCECEPGYRRGGPRNKCLPICNPSCGNHEFCRAPNQCDCRVGYMRVNGICEPQCEQGCGRYSPCKAPDVCSCTMNYEWNPNSWMCEPKCEPKCGKNSYCKGHNECECLTGYKPENATKQSCYYVMPIWLYWAIGLFVLLILGIIIGTIIYHLRKGRAIDYYPNSKFRDTRKIIDN
ncbi:wnt inhibitory factor 1-like [Drosophila busckii]|uniref:wnt inhibitory factor 1-like n=1 Tax=Drosophila busckii TaxID=30019 RepID=UPI00083F4C15|nr:wnt inhibitory factor 1-like [Drosophila busckii]